MIWRIGRVKKALAAGDGNRGESVSGDLAFPKLPLRPRLCLAFSFQFIRQLLLADFVQQRAHCRAGIHAERNQIVAGEQRRTDCRFLFQCLRLLN